MPPLVYVLPVHNEAQDLAANVARLTAYLDAEAPGSAIYLCENGSRDASWARCQELERRHGNVRAFRERRAGIGHGAHRGVSEALARFGPDPGRWVVITGADLPFGLSDVEAWRLALAEREARLVIGSKAHRGSRLRGASRTRRLMSVVYRGLRRGMAGMKVGDSQGSVFLRLDLAAALAPKIEARGFFYTTELCLYAERAGETIVEVPVVLREGRRPSTVRPLRDGLTMVKELFRVRRKH